MDRSYTTKYYYKPNPTKAPATMSVPNEATTSVLENGAPEDREFENILNFRDVGRTINDFVGEK